MLNHNLLCKQPREYNIIYKYLHSSDSSSSNSIQINVTHKCLIAVISHKRSHCIAHAYKYRKVLTEIHAKYISICRWTKRENVFLNRMQCGGISRVLFYAIIERDAKKLEPIESWNFMAISWYSWSNRRLLSKKLQSSWWVQTANI